MGYYARYKIHANLEAPKAKEDVVNCLNKFLDYPDFELNKNSEGEVESLEIKNFAEYNLESFEKLAKEIGISTLEGEFVGEDDAHWKLYKSEWYDEIDEVNGRIIYDDGDNYRYVLIWTDGYEIKTSVFDDPDDASDELKNDYYGALDGVLPEYEERSWCGDDNAVLYLNDEDVYVWSITQVRF